MSCLQAPRCGRVPPGGSRGRPGAGPGGAPGLVVDARTEVPARGPERSDGWRRVQGKPLGTPDLNLNVFSGKVFPRWKTCGHDGVRSGSTTPCQRQVAVMPLPARGASGTFPPRPGHGVFPGQEDIRAVVPSRSPGLSPSCAHALSVSCTGGTHLSTEGGDERVVLTGGGAYVLLIPRFSGSARSGRDSVLCRCRGRPGGAGKLSAGPPTVVPSARGDPSAEPRADVGRGQQPCGSWGVTRVKERGR